ncbi:ovomucoid-like isoform X2 [Notamacropus eugenii]|uniref:ovomucoid-like isoform X2 n=1 Tax=Notamacropus eugenii TaxID=9315 RepID=UPI003B678549
MASCRLKKKALLGLFIFTLTVYSGSSSEIECSMYMKRPPYLCTKESNPICASDGQTHGNVCMFCNALREDKSLQFVRFGHCP